MVHSFSTLNKSHVKNKCYRQLCYSILVDYLPNAMSRGEYGPKDIRETLDDTADLANRDQEEAGIDILTDGEMRR